MQDFAARRTIMVDTQVRPSDVTRYPVIAAMLAVPREVYVPTSRREAAYLGENLEIAPGRVLLEPRTFSKMLDGLAITPGDLVLDVGCGLGYSAAVIAQMAEAVVALEDEPLAGQAQTLLAGEGADNVAVIAGPLAAGVPGQAPYDVIVIEGAVEELPAALTDQLAEGGRIACLFRDGALGEVRFGIRRAGKIAWTQGFHAHAPVLYGFARAPVFAL
ncbi:protein-L-isoaspartate O-methyltransferase family protein [Phaeovulum vinaykumarii]|uniref:Protein-L-isoaspartate O-methyltransferase n=1 Tax=Phaeovulum vinaykumarii TaxID=407234 RepID=A0A1N7JNE5_9RHOB|nr:protein-L-isoaspartate O-methyltransferase [Phaeovulum vinaykumarii]SIS50827.1 protein-L-isoaspartate(D-aspartate) O-methyltransferase [Phaeovulum vinaykumarii]SOB90443.1 protein-L-isoaspartate(D-aspartate) O-methyltransferase [Phaeovulum vinaykumarii]